jgi:5-hydroxyisourate hydrolase
MKRISTHVLDVGRGKPAQGVPVRLDRRDTAGNWLAFPQAHTDQDGRCGQLLSGDELPPGWYRLVFDTAAYFSAIKVDGLYPVVEVTFEAREGESQIHIPLLLNANGYTTYRGT